MMQLREALDLWLATIAPDVFTHGDARKAIGVLCQIQLDPDERVTLSRELAARVAGGWLQRTSQGTTTERNYYSIRRRPVVAGVNAKAPVGDTRERLIQGIVALHDAGGFAKVNHVELSAPFQKVVEASGWKTLEHDAPIDLIGVDTRYLADLVHHGLFYWKDKNKQPVSTFNDSRKIYITRAGLAEMRSHLGASLKDYVVSLSTSARNGRGRHRTR